MQIAIDIPKELKEKCDSAIMEWAVRYIHAFDSDLVEAIRNGTVLEPHGRCVDVDAIVKKYGDRVAFLNGRVYGEYINAPTILEATATKGNDY